VEVKDVYSAWEVKFFGAEFVKGEVVVGSVWLAAFEEWDEGYEWEVDVLTVVNTANVGWGRYNKPVHCIDTAAAILSMQDFNETGAGAVQPRKLLRSCPSVTGVATYTLLLLSQRLVVQSEITQSYTYTQWMKIRNIYNTDYSNRRV
jgi:hypothetical protein